MEFALDRDGKRVHAGDADKNEEYTCPVCGAKVIPRQGKINIDHFAHVTPCEDAWAYDMSEWHRSWQEQFPKGNREIVLECDGEKHRADVLAYGYVLEFQHSPISREEFNRRNNFYIKAGKKVIWIFDFIDQRKKWQLDCRKEWRSADDNGGCWMWKYHKKFLDDFIPQEEKNIILFFQMEEADFKDKEQFYIERVVKVNTYKTRYGREWEENITWEWFNTSYYPGNKPELLDWMKNKKR